MTADPPKATRTRGILCPACGDPRMLTAYTRYRDGATVRVRRCAACGHRVRTAERVESRAVPPRKRG